LKVGRKHNYWKRIVKNKHRGREGMGGRELSGKAMRRGEDYAILLCLERLKRRKTKFTFLVSERHQSPWGGGIRKSWDHQGPVFTFNGKRKSGILFLAPE